MVRYAESKAKVAALSEVGFKDGEASSGLHHCRETEWLRACLVRPIKEHLVASRIAYIAFWKNEAYCPTHYHLPYAGSPHAECLAELSDDPFLVFGDRAEGLYRQQEAKEPVLVA
jgi:hypothetical protein